MKGDAAARVPVASRSPITVATYNVHGFVGGDRRRDPARVAAVIREIDPQVIGLQEVTHERGRGLPDGPLGEIAALTGLEPVFASTREDASYVYGNAILTSGRVATWSRHDLSLPRREPRVALASEIELEGRKLGCVTFHLGLRASERRAQTERLLSLIPPEASHPYVLLGDFNEWRASAHSLRACDARLAGCRLVPRSFPARFPILALDRIWAFPPTSRLETHAHRSALARIASDHLPLVARATLAESDAAPR